MIKVAPVLTERDFYVPRHGAIYRAMRRLYDRSEPTDIATVIPELGTPADVTAAGGRTYLVELIEDVASTANVVQYAEVVADKSRRRQVIAICNEIVSSAYAMELETPELIDRWQQSAFAIRQGGQRGGFKKLSDDNEDWLRRVDRLQKGEEQKQRVKTGFSRLDYMTQGFAPSELVTLAANTGEGKTQFALQIALHVAKTQGWGVAIQSLEMVQGEVNSRIQCAESWVDYADVERPGQLSQSDLNKLIQAEVNTRDYPIWVDDRAIVSPADMISNARQMVATHGIKLLIVDYMQLLSLNTLEQEKEYQALANLSNLMKAMAKELNIVVMAISQITAVKGQKPGLGSFRGSKAIGFAANTALFLHHGKKDGSTVIIAKNRRGPSNRRIPMHFKQGQWHEVRPEVGQKDNSDNSQMDVMKVGHGASMSSNDQ